MNHVSFGSKDFKTRVTGQVLWWSFAVIIASQMATLNAQTSYPRWFLSPGNYPEFIAGYTFGRSDAAIDAERTYCVYKKCILDGTLTIFLREDGNPDLRDSDYHYYFDQEDLDAITGKMTLYDGFVTNILRREMIGLYSLKSIDLPKDAFDQISIQNKENPEWTEKDVWEEGGFVYGVGRFQTTGNLNDAWKTTEERAIFRILNFSGMKFFVSQYYEESSRGESINEQVQAYKLRFRVNDIEIMERWKNIDSQTSYVLARISKVNIFAPTPQRRTVQTKEGTNPAPKTTLTSDATTPEASPSSTKKTPSKKSSRPKKP